LRLLRRLRFGRWWGRRGGDHHGGRAPRRRKQRPLAGSRHRAKRDHP
jgi:hypothetical protein